MTDKRNASEYYIMWGYLQNGDFYVMRTAVLNFKIYALALQTTTIQIINIIVNNT